MTAVRSVWKMPDRLQEKLPTDARTRSRRRSLVFERNDRLPEQRSGDKATHRLFHHYYEDLLM